MSDAILGYDCDRRELRAGDRVEAATLESLIQKSVSRRMFTLSGDVWLYCGCTAVGFVEPDDDGDECGGYPHALRLINSGRELFDQCAREADKMPTESTIRVTEKEES